MCRCCEHCPQLVSLFCLLPSPALTLTLHVNSFDVKGPQPSRTYQVLWNEVTCLGPGWVTSDISSAAPDSHQPIAGSLKRRASSDLCPPARRGPSLLAKLDAPIASAVNSKLTVSKGKGKSFPVEPSVLGLDSEVTEYEEDVMKD